MGISKMHELQYLGEIRLKIYVDHKGKPMVDYEQALDDSVNLCMRTLGEPHKKVLLEKRKKIVDAAFRFVYLLISPTGRMELTRQVRELKMEHDGLSDG